MTSPTNFLNADFKLCLSNLMENGMEVHPRGTSTREILNYNITLLDPRNRVVTFPSRKTNTAYLLGEFIWYMKGENTADGILPYAKFWDGIRNSGNEPGYPAGTVNSNYGNRLFGHARKDLAAFRCHDNQWSETVKLLTKDKDTRQAIMNIHVPSDRHDGNKDVACTLSLQWFIREERLHLIVNMRSNDVILGFTNDVFQFTMLQEAMLLNLRHVYPNLQLGHYFHNAGSMHIYDRHFKMAEAIASEPAMDVMMIPMDAFTDDVLTGLVGVEAAWQAAGASPDFEFDQVGAWALLTPYWRTLVKAFFGQDEAALHAIFGQTE